MNIHDILAALQTQLSRLDAAIAALEGSTPKRGPGRPRKAQAHLAPAAKRRGMSADARKRIGLAMKLAWAKRKGKTAPKKAASSTKKPARKPMSPAGRKKLAALMKARWAEKKKAGAKSL